MNVIKIMIIILLYVVSDMTLLVGQQEGHSTCRKPDPMITKNSPVADPDQYRAALEKQTNYTETVLVDITVS